MIAEGDTATLLVCEEWSIVELMDSSSAGKFSGK